MLCCNHGVHQVTLAPMVGHWGWVGSNNHVGHAAGGAKVYRSCSEWHGIILKHIKCKNVTVPPSSCIDNDCTQKDMHVQVYTHPIYKYSQNE